MQEATEIDIIPAIKTDHSAVILNILPEASFKRGPSYWKFNNSLLSEKSNVELIQREINLIVTDPPQELTDPRAKLEFLKYKIFTRNYSANRTKSRTKHKTQVENKLKQFAYILSVSSLPDVVKEYEECKAKLESINDHTTQGIILRSKITWYEKGEKSNKYFLNLGKRNKTKSHIRKLLINNQALSNPTTILQEFKGFYNSLYTSKSLKSEQECLGDLNDINTPLLSEHESLSCEGKLTLKEIYQAL